MWRSVGSGTAAYSDSVLTMCSPIANEAVAAGLGALSTCSAR
jgi:hypothetical protein